MAIIIITLVISAFVAIWLLVSFAIAAYRDRKPLHKDKVFPVSQTPVDLIKHPTSKITCDHAKSPDEGKQPPNTLPGIIKSLPGPPQLTEHIICLANSYKNSGRCVAGKRFKSGANNDSWVRPISIREGHEISEAERRYSNGELAEVLDIINVPIIAVQPHPYQIENTLIDNRYLWKLAGKITWDQLKLLAEPPLRLWVSWHHSCHGVNNRVPENLLEHDQGSLKLIALENLVLRVGPQTSLFGNTRLKIKGSFAYAGQRYSLDVTDPIIGKYVEHKYLTDGTGEHNINFALVCVSLGEVFNGYAYKLIASIITEKRATG